MELKVGQSQFSNNGGGGGTFFMGRGDKDESKKGKDEETEDEVGELEGDEMAFSGRSLGRDGMRLPPRHSSHLSLYAPAPVAIWLDPDAVVAQLEGEIQGKMRVLVHAVSRLERDFARRLRAEVGEMLIGA